MRLRKFYLLLVWTSFLLCCAVFLSVSPVHVSSVSLKIPSAIEIPPIRCAKITFSSPFTVIEGESLWQGGSEQCVKRVIAAIDARIVNVHKAIDQNQSLMTALEGELARTKGLLRGRSFRDDGDLDLLHDFFEVRRRIATLEIERRALFVPDTSVEISTRKIQMENRWRYLAALFLLGVWTIFFFFRREFSRKLIP